MNTFPIVCVMGLLCALTASAAWFRKRNVLEAAVMGIVLFFFDYIFVSMGLFVIDYFSLFRAAFGAMVLDAAVMTAAVLVRRGKGMKLKKLFDLDFTLKGVIIPLVVCVVAFPFVSVKNELFGMGQDEGVYQVQALYFMNDDNARQKDFREYHLLETDEERKEFEYFARNYIRGYDIQSKAYPDTVYDYDVSPVSGIFHGIPTYTAILAMWGTLFGAENMLGIENVFFFLLIFLIYFVCRNLKLKDASSLCACAVTAVSPIVIWVTKSALTEIFLCVIVASFMYFMTDDEKPGEKWLSIIPVAVFGCYHVSIYTMLPLFIMIYGGMYFFTREKQYAILTPAVTAGYLASYFMMRQVQPMYTMNNYRPVFKDDIVTVFTITMFVPVAAGCIIAASLLYVRIVSGLGKNKKNDIRRLNKKAAESKAFRIFLTVLLTAPTLLILWNIRKYGWFTSIFGFLFAGGLILIPLAFALTLASPKFFIEKNSRLVMLLMFFYCVLVYCAVLRPNIRHYYYYSRYLAPFIPVAAIFSVLTLDRWGRKLVYPAACAGVLFAMPYSLFLANTKDDTRMEWSVLYDVVDTVREDTCVVVSKFYDNQLWLHLKSLTDADIYPQFDDEDQLKKLSQKYKRVLLVTEKEMFDSEYVTCYRNVINHIEDDLNRPSRMQILPRKYWEVQDNIYVYSYEKYKREYSAKWDYHYFDGFDIVEDTFCWSNTEKSLINTRLISADYNMKITLGCGLPFNELGKDEVSVTVYVNGEKAGTTAFTRENVSEGAELKIAKELVKDGRNVIELETELWHTSIITPDDERLVGIPLSVIEFTAA